MATHEHNEATNSQWGLDAAFRDTKLTLRTVRFDTVIAKHFTGVSPGLIKLDCEGCEWDIVPKYPEFFKTAKIFRSEWHNHESYSATIWNSQNANQLTKNAICAVKEAVVNFDVSAPGGTFVCSSPGPGGHAAEYIRDQLAAGKVPDQEPDPTVIPAPDAGNTAPVYVFNGNAADKVPDQQPDPTVIPAPDAGNTAPVFVFNGNPGSESAQAQTPKVPCFQGASRTAIQCDYKEGIREVTEAELLELGEKVFGANSHATVKKLITESKVSCAVQHP
jgi:hypothetical protein